MYRYKDLDGVRTLLKIEFILVLYENKIIKRIYN